MIILAYLIYRKDKPQFCRKLRLKEKAKLEGPCRMSDPKKLPDFGCGFLVEVSFILASIGLHESDRNVHDWA